MTESLLFDDASLKADDAELATYRWLTAAEKSLLSSSPDDLKSVQAAFEALLIKLVTQSGNFPAPGRPLRNSAARCFIVLYERAETKSRFDTLRTFLSVAGDLKTADTVKVACLYCTGEIMSVYGSHILSLIGDVSTTALRLVKNSALSVIVRYNSLTALRKSLASSGRGLPESALKDILKQSRQCLSDKACAVQQAAAELLAVLYSQAETIRTVAEVESIITLCVKCLDTADQPTRRSLSSLVAKVLQMSLVDRVITSNDKKAKKEAESGPEPGEQAVDSGKPLLGPNEILIQLSTQFNKASTSRKARVAIIGCYATLLTTLGPEFVESNYFVIFKHLAAEIVVPVRLSTNSHEVYLIRKLVGLIMGDLIGARLLSEQGQIAAIKELASTYLSKWPALLPGQVAPQANVLVVALKEIAGLLQQLGNAPLPVQDALADPLLRLLSHSSPPVHTAAAWALRCFCYSTPSRLPRTIIDLMEMLQRDLSSLATPQGGADVGRRAVGHAHGLAALFAIIPHRPLYVSYDLSAKLFDMSIQLLKRAGEHEVSLATVEVEVAWTSISSLMALGPNFVRSHLPQLLVLWRNALPKPTSKDSANAGGRSAGEWVFLLQVREAALGAILAFLKHNSPVLVTLDVSRRVSLLLQNALAFVNAYTAQPQDEHQEAVTVKESMLRRRVYQCFTALGAAGSTEPMQTSLIQSASTLFASYDGWSGSSIQAAIASSAGTFSSVWSMSDGYAYGVMSATTETVGDVGMSPLEVQNARASPNNENLLTKIDCLNTMPAIGSCEHDLLSLCGPQPISGDAPYPDPPPPSTGVVDAAIRLFSVLLPVQDTSSASRAINHMIQNLSSPKLERNVGRKAAGFINSVVAILLSLRNVATRQHRDVLGGAQISGMLANFLKDAIYDGDEFLRRISSEAMGRLASISGSAFLNGQCKLLIEQIVDNRDPPARAGCAITLGEIFTHVGGLAAGPLLKGTVNVLMSLGNDPHPLVHYWALTSLSHVINAASLSYGPYLPSTVKMIFKLYSTPSHETEGGSIINSNVAGDLPIHEVMCQLLDALISVLGPELQDPDRASQPISSLVLDFWKEDEEGTRIEAIKCVQHLLMFAPNTMDVPKLVVGFRKQLSAPSRPLKMASINALYQLVQKDALLMSKVGGDRLVEDLFAMLDVDSAIDGVKNIITSWLQQTVSHNPSAWIDLCQRIMSKTTASQRATDASNNPTSLQDDEAESLGISAGGTPNSAAPTSRWRTQLFALECLHQICTTVIESGRREHFDLPYARAQRLQASSLLVSRVPDLIRMAFTASAAYVTDIRLQGLIVLRDVILGFAKSPDSEYDEALLLEQHQAPITAALTPAFSSDSSPEILASGIQVCASFVGSGVVKDVGRMGRILRLLTAALDKSEGSGTLKLGEMDELSPNASSMLRICTLTAWAELQVATKQQTYLEDVVAPHREPLSALWVAALRDFASLRGDTEVLQDSTLAAMEVSYSGMGREVLLPYYEKSWIKLLQAVTSLMAVADKSIGLALDGQDPKQMKNDRSQSSEPVAYFWMLYGLVFEQLAASASDGTASTATSEGARTALEALKNLVKPEYSGKAIVESHTFDELKGLAYRMALTTPPVLQVRLVEAITSLAISQKDHFISEALMTTGVAEDFSGSSSLTHCLRICALILRQAVPSVARTHRTFSGSGAEQILVISASFNSIVMIGSVYSVEFQNKIREIAASLYVLLLKNDSSDIDLCGPTLPCLKAIIHPTESIPGAGQAYERLVHALLSACAQHVDEMRGREGPGARNKVKSNLLAASLIITTVSTNIKLSEAMLEQICYQISHSLEGPLEVSLTAAHCAKTIITTSAAGNPALRHCIKLLMPGMIQYIATVAAPAKENDQQAAQLAGGVEEILKALVSFFGSVQDEYRPRLLGVLLPLCALLLDPFKTPASLTHNRTVVHLLAFATSAPAAFKEATSKLDEDTRERLETSVRQAIGSTGSQTASTAKPQISLRSF